MKNNKLSFVALVFSLLLCFVSCKSKYEVSIERLDREMFLDKSKDGIRLFLNKHKNVSKLYFVDDFINDTLLTNEIYRRINYPEFDTLYRQVEDEFGDMTTLRDELTEAFTNIKKIYPDFRYPRVVTMVSGINLGTDLFVSDSLIIIGIDYFIGPKAKYRPTGSYYPQYILRQYQKEYIVPAIVKAISAKYNRSNPTDGTLLSDMVYYGKEYAFSRTILPQVPDSLIIGYSENQLKETYDAQDVVWGHFIDNQLLYVSNPSVKQRYLNERPYTAEIGQRCPGAIGRWIGWRIIERYQKTNTDVSISALMANSDALQIFSNSNYKGQLDE